MRKTAVDLSGLKSKWGSTVVAREEIRNFSGGAISEKYVANLDSQGRGPSGRFRCGRKILYPVDDLIRWLEARSEVA
ncbi:MAG: hypothetical protein KG012_09360 [Deltaproteobacteria bacterium]|nr:hypothetical protein [Deltaproteobacteria bacterium]